MIRRWRQEFQAQAVDIFMDKRNPRQKRKAMRQGSPPMISRTSLGS